MVQWADVFVAYGFMVQMKQEYFDIKLRRNLGVMVWSLMFIGHLNMH